MSQLTVSRIRRASRPFAGAALALVALGTAGCSDDARSPLPTAIAPSPVFAKSSGGASKQRILFASDRDGNLELYSMNPDGTGVTRLTNNPADDSPGGWSPDGKHIAFTSTRDNPHGDIYVMNADGTGVVRVTFGPGVIQQPSWSKDGSQLVFVSTRDAADPANADLSDFEIYTMNVDGTGIKRLTNNKTFDSDPAWSPDGGRIAFTSGQDHPGTDRTELYVMNSDGSSVTRRTFQDGVVQIPSWDPHSRRIAFSTAFGIANGVYILNADDSMLRLTLGASGVDAWPSWSPDGSSLAFLSHRDGNPEIYSMNVDGTGQTRLTFSPGFDSFPRWSR